MNLRPSGCEPEGLTNALCARPKDKPPIENEAIIERWLAREDGTSETLVASFYSDEGMIELPKDEFDKNAPCTKLGSVPFWLDGTDQQPDGDWTFVGQIDEEYSFLQPPSVLPEWISEDEDKWEGRTHMGELHISAVGLPIFSCGPAMEPCQR